MKVNVQKNLMSKNDVLAVETRQQLAELGIYCINIIAPLVLVKPPCWRIPAPDYKRQMRWLLLRRHCHQLGCGTHS